MHSPLLIHNDNTSTLEYFNLNSLKLELDSDQIANSDIDSYISKNVIPILNEKSFSVLYIKDSLSSNYLDLFGLLLIYHIRLSKELKEKRFVPIVILSSLDGYTLNKLSPLGEILFSENVFIATDKSKSVEYYNKIFEKKIYECSKNLFNQIHVSPPSDYLSHHSIANEWGIMRWSDLLQIESNSISELRNKVSSMLYYKFLLSKYPIMVRKDLPPSINVKEEGKVLYIDDEWNKGWKDVLEYFFRSSSAEFTCMEYIYKDKSVEQILGEVISFIHSNKDLPDIIILDLRLHDSDFDINKEISNLSGMLLLEKIQQINPGIQVIIFTASNKSLILDELYQRGILGYIKKEDPNDLTVETNENINHLVELVNTGFDRKYLKEVYQLQQNILEILARDPFQQYIGEKVKYEYYLHMLIKNTEYIFKILDSSMENKLNYAMVSIATSLESIVKIFLYGKDDLLFWDKQKAYLRDASKLVDKIAKIVNSKMGYDKDIQLEQLIKHRNDYMHSNSSYKEVTPDKIMAWINEFCKIIEIIEKPPKYIPYTESDKKESKHHVFKKS